MAFGELLATEVELAENGGQLVVDVMGDAPGQGPHGFHALAVLQLALQAGLVQEALFRLEQDPLQAANFLDVRVDARG